MTKILCIETSGINCSVAISEENSLLAEKAENKGKFTHAESLHVFINEVLDLANISINELDAIAVSGGPGSYTGLRIGVSTAKGLCFALNKPLIAISTLQILASQITENEFIIPMLDARRMEVYSAVFDKSFNEIEKTEAKILDENSYTEWLSKGKVVFLGDGVDKFSEICRHPNAFFVKNAYPQAKDMIPHAFEKFKNRNFEDIAYFEPNYLK
ncbi:tRNA (adenosine(37)-N6)-threonylcarbamoyltransferase complex dimerization subunit type 1 TsaB [Capnocytophaga felis]|uniref:tRNA (Adenosine(37)-N6)-threonylcarbamoyltransferase complex dimerization subunit type 1 TsaB n=1 Tax=Capnocytophaga felis TaxID=2267611 RepID=A0A5M4B7Z2_9FLAO|nr:tRNA (adenosine(37)-N6)-threonylcarbamoyltransferase complex dimerization subunit type 1 TsaB [Capnocytophaga felis]GET45377.1 tRNA (adenosine(37)-N6)-threonylcarbamoyltransferase complex dimerization subunit type 1 TsaB [Capnocytophaga felis]GET47460.1 tRNA (adenosine(37)-N6)-threonylcarbamoyltransferase complex dimerization subunit type 1 TsaB [Capnocytophaga felis]